MSDYQPLTLRRVLTFWGCIAALFVLCIGLWIAVFALLSVVL